MSTYLNYIEWWEEYSRLHENYWYGLYASISEVYGMGVGIACGIDICTSITYSKRAENGSFALGLYPETAVVY